MCGSWLMATRTGLTIPKLTLETPYIILTADIKQGSVFAQFKDQTTYSVRHSCDFSAG